MADLIRPSRRRFLKGSAATLAFAARQPGPALAGVKTLVLNHFVPADDRSITEELWKAAVRTTFDGGIVVGRDLLDIPLSGDVNAVSRP